MYDMPQMVNPTRRGYQMEREKLHSRHHLQCHSLRYWEHSNFSLVLLGLLVLKPNFNFKVKMHSYLIQFSLIHF